MSERVRNLLTNYRKGFLTEADFMLALLTVCPSIEALVDVALTFQAEDASRNPPPDWEDISRYVTSC